MSFWANIIGKLNKSKLQFRFQDTTFSQNRMQGIQISYKCIDPLKEKVENTVKHPYFQKQKHII